MAQTGERLGRKRVAWEKCPRAAVDDPRVEQLLRLYPDHTPRDWIRHMVAWQRRADSWERAYREEVGS